MFEIFMALNSTIFIEHILRWCFIHYKSITSFFIFRCLSFGVFFRVRVVLLYILYNTLIILSKALHIVIITLLYKCLVDGQFIVTLSVCFLVQIKAALSIDSRARLRLLLALYLDLLWLCRIDCKRQIFLLYKAQALYVLFGLEYFVPVYLLKFYFLHAILTVRMVPYDGLKSARVYAIDLTNDANVLVLVLVFWYDHV